MTKETSISGQCGLFKKTLINQYQENSLLLPAHDSVVYPPNTRFLLFLITLTIVNVGSFMSHLE